MRILEYNQRNWRSLEKKLQGGSFPEEKLVRVREIIAAVRKDGDRALRSCTARFDGVEIDRFKVTPAEFKEARRKLTPEIEKAFSAAAKNIRSFHASVRHRSWIKKRGNGMEWGEKISPVDSAGIYIPGGRFPLVSSLFMTAIPAREAGVMNIIPVSPPGKNGAINPYLLLAADFLGLRDFYKVGGAQAIAALAFGTESIPAVDLIVGPGNIYVTLAKKEVFGRVGIDMLAGPSEIAILADGQADPGIIAWDLLAQSEHGAGGSSILISTSRRLLEETGEELEKSIAAMAGKENGGGDCQDSLCLIKVKSLSEGIEAVNLIAPEHLEIMTADPDKIVPKIRNAGAIFIGEYSPVAVGDYLAGPSHVLPTGRSARYASPLSVDTFIKRSSVIKYTRHALEEDLSALKTLAELEGLDYHARSAEIRLEK